MTNFTVSCVVVSAVIRPRNNPQLSDSMPAQCRLPQVARALFQKSGDARGTTAFVFKGVDCVQRRFLAGGLPVPSLFLFHLPSFRMRDDLVIFFGPVFARVVCVNKHAHA